MPQYNATFKTTDDQELPVTIKPQTPYDTIDNDLYVFEEAVRALMYPHVIKDGAVTQSDPNIAFETLNIKSLTTVEVPDDESDDTTSNHYTLEEIRAMMILLTVDVTPNGAELNYMNPSVAFSCDTATINYFQCASCDSMTPYGEYDESEYPDECDICETDSMEPHSVHDDEECIICKKSFNLNDDIYMHTQNFTQNGRLHVLVCDDCYARHYPE